MRVRIVRQPPVAKKYRVPPGSEHEVIDTKMGVGGFVEGYYIEAPPTRKRLLVLTGEVEVLPGTDQSGAANR